MTVRPPGGVPDVLFAGHDATRTGAPLMLLYFLRWLRQHTDLVFELVLVDGGALVDDFADVCRVTVLADVGDTAGPRWLDRLGLRKAATALRTRRKRAVLGALRQAPTVYCNSSSCITVVPLLGPAHPDRVVITHVHEMEAGLQSMGPGVLDLVFSLSDWLVAASDRVRGLLIDGYGADPAHVIRHYEFIDVDAMAGEPPDIAEVRAAREQCGIPDGAAVVGAVGVTQWRKGPDLFLLLAHLMGQREQGREVHFVWLGADPEAEETRSLLVDIARTGLGGRVHLVPPERAPARWFALFDVFVLTSREDPFPLVCLESSLLGTPIVCFDNTGMAEFAGDGDCGYMVDYLDVEAMCERVASLLDDHDLRRAVGERAAARVRAEFDVEAAAPALHRDLERWRRHP